jgi:protein-disulfide isomerase
MKNKNLALMIAAIVLFGGLFFILKKNFSAQPTPAAVNVQNAESAQSFRMVPFEKELLIKPYSPTKGPASAKVTLVEFLDPECEACAATYPFVKAIMKEFGKDVKVVVRYMPFHQNSKYVANVLEGIRLQGKYWEALELLFATQNQWAAHHDPKPELIPEVLAPLGLKLDSVIADAKAGKYNQQVDQDFADGKAAGVRGTPTFFVNGVMVYELSFESLRAAVQNALGQ